MHLAHQPDVKPHSSIQTWSRGPIFPAVIKRVETYPNPLGFSADVHPNVLRPLTDWRVLLNGQTTAHDSYDEAYAYAERHARHQVALDRCRENAKPAPDLRAKDSDGHLLEAGALYCERYTDEYGEGEHRYGRLVWYGGVGRRFFDADTHEEATPEGDALVRQNVTLNVAYTVAPLAIVNDGSYRMREWQQSERVDD